MKPRKQTITVPLDDSAKAQVFAMEKGVVPPEGYLRDYVALFLSRNRIPGRYEMPHMIQLRLVGAVLLAVLLAVEVICWRFDVGSVRVYAAVAAAAVAVYALLIRYVCSMQRYLIRRIRRHPDADIDVFLFDTLSVAEKRILTFRRSGGRKEDRKSVSDAARNGTAGWPDTLNEMAVYSRCRAFAEYFDVSQDVLLYFFGGLADGDILSVQGTPDGIIRIRNRRETVMTTLNAAPAMQGGSVSRVTLTKDGLQAEP